jgi:colanic acid/amylovoran biosynthesis glycosyltransferase
MENESRPAVVHLVTPYLFVTGSWVYTQLTGLEHYHNVVFTQRSENLDIFPFEELYSSGSFPLPQRLVNKVWRRVFDQYGLFFDKPAQSLRPVLFQAHFGYEAARWLHFVERTGLPLVTTFYGMDVSQLGRIPKWQKRYHKLFKYGKTFLAEGSFLKKQLMNLGCPEEKVIVQHLGVELGKYPQKSFSNHESDQHVVILQVSSFREKKGIEYSLEAIAQLRKMGCNVEFRLIGSGDTPEAEIAVRAIVDRLNINHCVSLLGIKEHSDVIREMVNADIFLHPSVTAADGDNEGGVPVGIIEASAVGLPVVSTRHADIPEVVLDGVTGYLAPERDSKQLAEKIVSLIQSPKNISLFGEAGRKHIDENYNLRIQLQKLENIYAACLQ